MDEAFAEKKFGKIIWMICQIFFLFSLESLPNGPGQSTIGWFWGVRSICGDINGWESIHHGKMGAAMVILAMVRTVLIMEYQNNKPNGPGQSNFGWFWGFESSYGDIITQMVGRRAHVIDVWVSDKHVVIFAMVTTTPPLL